ncbi:MAG: hypothetical protein M3R38_07630 [Actinomycetota bacterium]|nr:hypothetical protein [Actinomycetota bacterium]
MGQGRPFSRGKLRLTREAVELWQAGATLAEVSRRLKSPKHRVSKILKPFRREETS